MKKCNAYICLINCNPYICLLLKMRSVQIIILLSLILSFSSCCPVDDNTVQAYFRSNKQFRNFLTCSDTSSRILSIHYPIINRIDTGINARSATILLPTNATADIIVTTNIKTDTIRVLSELSLRLESSDYFCGNNYVTINKYSVPFTTAASVKILDYDFSNIYYSGVSGSFGYQVMLIQN